LLQRRMDTKKWCIISGHVEFGETVEEAIKREVFEEVNVNSEVVRLIGVYSSPDHTTYRYQDRIVQYVVTYFEVKLKDQLVHGLSNSEMEEFAYFPVNRLPKEIDFISPFWLQDALAFPTSAFIR
jgi:8-oxo-dGTP diphosphatase